MIRARSADISTTVNSTLQLVRSYALTYDYSTFPGVYFDHGDGGGASGRLTLTQMTQYGTDGVGTANLSLPTNVFTYANNRLLSAENGIGGKVSYAYQTLTIGHLPGGALYPLNDPYQNIAMDWKSNGALPQWGINDGHGVMNVIAQAAPSYVYLQDAVGKATPGAVYTYTVEVLCGFCGATMSVRLSVYDGTTETFVTPWVYPTGYSQIVSGTWTAGDNSGGKIELRIYTQNYVPIHSYSLAQPYTKHRVTSKSVYDRVSSPITYTFSYSGAALNDIYQSEAARVTSGRKDPNTEFRGHSLVSVTDPTGARTDNYFLQDDIFTGRAVTTTQYSARGAKLASTINTPQQDLCLGDGVAGRSSAEQLLDYACTAAYGDTNRAGRGLVRRHRLAHHVHRIVDDV